MRKTREKTPWEKVEDILEGLSNEIAADIAALIMAQVLAKRYYLQHDFEKYIKEWHEKMIGYTKEYLNDNQKMLSLAKSVKGIKNT